MGMYTGMRFRGTLRAEYIERFAPVMERGDWSMLSEFSIAQTSRAGFIPKGAVCYMPDSWEYDGLYDEYFNKEDGRVRFQCSLKNYENEIELFLEDVPILFEEAEIEVMYELWEGAIQYLYVDGESENDEVEEIGFVSYERVYEEDEEVES